MIVDLNTDATAIKNNIIRGGVKIAKWDIELNRQDPQGDATLEGAVFDIYNESINAVLVNDVLYQPGEIVYTDRTDADGNYETTNNLLPYGTYKIVESEAPIGYLNTGKIEQVFTIREHGVIVDLNNDSSAIKNNVIRGGVKIAKWDLELNEQTPQGDATLMGATFDIYNESLHVVLVNGTEYDPGEICYTDKTDAYGNFQTSSDALPYGSYRIVESSPPEGYLNTGKIEQTFQIRENGLIVDLNTDETAIKNNIIRGGVLIEKWDAEIDRNESQGGATLEGAVFELYNRSLHPVLVEDVLYDVDELIATFLTDENGRIETSDDYLPYGTYEFIEVEAPEGYLSKGVLEQTFSIREHGVIVEMNTSETAIKNYPKRGDLKLVKISDSDMKRLANVPFQITSLTTGESHIIVTDDNGQASTESSWNLHSSNTNRGESSEDGVWFGEEWTLDDEKGALLYDWYEIEELPCKANKKYALSKFQIRVYKDSVTVDVGTLTDDYIEISTLALDKDTGTHTAVLSNETTIVDKIYYTGLQLEQEYTLVGKIIDKTTGEVLIGADGNEVSSTLVFTPKEAYGNVEMEFTFDSTNLKGDIVVYEYLYILNDDSELISSSESEDETSEDKTSEDENSEDETSKDETSESNYKLIAEHADIDDEDQTISFSKPNICTTALGEESRTHHVDAEKDVVIVDKVKYVGLIPGKEYKVIGNLMDYETQKIVVDADGKEVTSTVSFTPEKSNGYVTVEFTLNASSLYGKTTVVFEYLYLEDVLIAEHTEIEDEDQTIYFMEEFPEIKTSARDSVSDNNTALISDTTTIIDSVTIQIR